MAIVSSNIPSRVSNRMNMLPRLSSTRLYDNYLSNNVYDKIIELKYSPCNKFYRYAIIPNINLENFLKNIKIWVKNILRIPADFHDMEVFGWYDNRWLKITEHFQTMEELRNVHSYEIHPKLNSNITSYFDFIPRYALNEENASHIEIYRFKTPSQINIQYFECTFKMDTYKKRYNIIENWTVSEFMSTVLRWFMEDCRLDETKEYEIVSITGQPLTEISHNMSIKNFMNSNRNLFPAFYIREKSNPIINIPNTSMEIRTIITPIIERIVPMDDCSVCFESIEDNIQHRRFRGCRHLLCNVCNWNCIRANHINCPQCRRPRL